MTVLQLKRMRAAAREKALAADPVLRQEWEKALAAEKAPKPVQIKHNADDNGMFMFCCSECGNRFKAPDAFYARCSICGEDTNGMVTMI